MMETSRYPLSMGIKSWAENDRPREKMLVSGKAQLSDAELLAILIGSGTVGEDALQLAQKILDKVNGDLSALGRRSLKDLMQFRGIGTAKAITIAAALELGRRRQFSDSQQRTSITSSQDVFEYIAPHLIDLPHEEFWIVLLDRANHILGRHRISTGGVAGTVVDAKMVFKPALEVLASGIILIHNHPSGNIKPSIQDLNLTKKLKEAGHNLDIVILDHLIVAHSGFYSFVDNNVL